MTESRAGAIFSKIEARRTSFRIGIEEGRLVTQLDQRTLNSDQIVGDGLEHMVEVAWDNSTGVLSTTVDNEYRSIVTDTDIRKTGRRDLVFLGASIKEPGFKGCLTNVEIYQRATNEMTGDMRSIIAGLIKKQYMIECAQQCTAEESARPTIYAKQAEDEDSFWNVFDI